MKRKNNIYKIINSKIFPLTVFLLITIIFSNCSVDKFKQEQKDRFSEVFVELDHNKRLWEEHQLKDYEFICQQFGGGSVGWGEALIKVKQGKSVSIENTNKQELGKLDGYENIETIEKVFEYIKQNLDAGKRIDVKYHEQLGYPMEVKITVSYAIDAWRGFFIRELKNTSDNNNK